MDGRVAVAETRALAPTTTAASSTSQCSAAGAALLLIDSEAMAHSVGIRPLAEKARQPA
jgi:hypothetical protein